MRALNQCAQCGFSESVIHTTHNSPGPWVHARRPGAPCFDKQWIQVYTFLVRTFPGSARCDEMVEEEHEHDLSHQVFYHKNGYSLFRPTGALDCKSNRYTPPRGTKAANSGGGIYLKCAADYLLGARLTTHLSFSINPSISGRKTHD